MREKSAGKQIQEGELSGWEKLGKWEKNNDDVVAIINQVKKILTSGEGGREKTVQMTAKFLSEQPIDLLDLWSEDEHLEEYLRGRKDLGGHINDLRSAMDLARVYQTKKPAELSETDADKIIGSVFSAVKEKEADGQSEDKIKNNNEANVWPERFMEALIDAEKQSWEDFLNTAAAVNREKEFISDAEYNQLRKDLSRSRDKSEASAFTDAQRQYLREFFAKLDKKGQFDEFVGFYWTKHLKKSKGGK